MHKMSCLCGFPANSGHSLLLSIQSDSRKVLDSLQKYKAGVPDNSSHDM